MSEEPKQFARCKHLMFSGLNCSLLEGHDGRHTDRFGLHDPLGWRDDD